MRIAILSNAFPPDGKGGAEMIAALQADVLFERGNEIAVWAPGERNEVQSNEVVEAGEGKAVNGTVRRFSSVFTKLNAMNAFRRFSFHVSDRGVNHHVAHEIYLWKPDVVMTHNLTGCGLGTPSYLQLRGVRWIHTLHDVQLFEPSGQKRADRKSRPYERAWRRFWSWLRRRSFGVPDVLVSPSGWLLHAHEHYGFKGKKMIILPNPVDLSSGGLERTLHRPSTLAFVGRLSKDKGIDVFSDICRFLIRKEEVNRILVAGEGADRKMLPVDAMIDWRGQIPADEARALIAEADLLIAPSRLAENQPTVILEAMAEGTPVIVSDTAGARELLAGTGAPIICWSGETEDSFRQEAVSLLNDPKRWHAISRAMHDRARERHDAGAYGDQLMKLIG